MGPRALFASLSYQCEVNVIVRAAYPGDGPVLSTAELKMLERCYHDGLSSERVGQLILAARERRAVA